jgi:DNA-binding protein HU-beta
LNIQTTDFPNGGMIMNKAELIEKVAAEVGTTKAQAEKLLDCTLDVVKKAVKKGDEVKLVGFGTFVKAKRKARTGRNPQTGKAIKIPATSFPKFRPGAEFKSLVR